MTVKFTKMHGAGNDFVVVDDLRGTFPSGNPALIAALAARRTGIGCEGVILAEKADPASGADYKMRFFNPDGYPASMCGNGARCVALFAFRRGIAGISQKIETDSGIVSADILEPGLSGALVKVTMTPASAVENRVVKVKAGSFECLCVNTGVPHAVVFVENADAADVRTVGRQIRESDDFAPDGTNVDFAEVVSPGEIVLRVYERGVEDESGACGTGAVAAAIASFYRGTTGRNVSIRVSSGDTLEVSVLESGAPALTGPACIVFEGSAEI